MSEILVAEDSPTQTIHIKHILTTAGFQVETAANGDEALRAIERRPPDLVLTDLDMPKLNGLQLVEAVHRRFPRVPVVLMTAFGSDEVAARALEAGAASYVPKRNLDKELIETLTDLLALVATNKELERLSEFLTGQDARFRVGNDLSSIQPIVSFLQLEMAELNLGDETERIRLGIAVAAALRNVICYGNLELSPTNDREAAGGGARALERLVAERAAQPPYRERNAWLEARLQRNEAAFVIGHEGSGTELRRLLEADDATQFNSAGDGGWVLVKSFMDDVALDADGKQLSMTKRSLKVTG